MKTSAIPLKLKHIVIFFCLTSLAIITSCTNEPIDPVPRMYIALGDSVSSGFGLAGYGTNNNYVPLEGRHTTIFFEKLNYADYVDEYRNMAVSGYTTTSLLEMLAATDEKTLNYFHNAEVITLNIGGNNILSPFLYYLSNLQAATGVDNILSGAGVLSEAWRMVYDAASSSAENENAETNMGVDDVLSGFGDLITGGVDIVFGLPDVLSVLTGSISPELQDALEEGVQVFVYEFSQIIEWLETNAPNAVIVINTIYNPIPNDVVGLTIALAGLAEEFIETMNRMIIEEGEARGFIVIDMHSYFDNRPDMMRFNLDPFEETISFDIVHPNENGHSFIAQLQYRYFRQHYLYR